MLTTHNLGLSITTPEQTLRETLQQQTGFDFVSLGCSGVADPILSTMELLGQHSTRKQYKAHQAAQWFNTDRECVVPEFSEDTRFQLNAAPLVQQIKQAQQAEATVKPIVIGPLTYLWFSSVSENDNKLHYLAPLLAVYTDLINELSAVGIEWIQFDEPVLGQTLDSEWKHALLQSYFALQRTPVKKMLACYFGKLGENLSLVRELTVDGIHLDSISAPDEALKVADLLPHYKVVSLAVVDAALPAENQVQDNLHPDTDTTESEITEKLAWLNPIYDQLGERLWLAPSCSLQYAPDCGAPQHSVNDALQQQQHLMQQLAQRLSTTQHKSAA